MKDSTDKVAINLATSTAQKATDLANTAVSTATDLTIKTAETTRQITENMAIINTNMEWMKASLVKIETKLNEMDKAFVTAAQHTEVLKELAEHETRINGLETERTRVTLLLAVASALLTILMGIVIYHIFQV